MGGEAEPVRLVIWDLDETLWNGTYTEGGISYRQDVHDIVVALAHRGIISSICSKNELAPIRAILQQHGLWDYLIFPSVDWSPKGPRLHSLLRTIGLRPQTALFIDDNASNRAEAEHCVPGLRAVSQHAIPHLLGDPRLRGQVDPGLTRLKHYQIMQTRKQAETDAATGSDSTAFLRESGIRVWIEHEVEPHLNRAVELINRTNQLNFTKSRLPEDIADAQAALRELLESRMVKAGLLRVQDRHGDHGFCGFYAVHHQHAHAPRLIHFCFSCRIMNMGVETWLYRALGRPTLKIQGDVVSDVINDTREIDWISVSPDAHAAAAHSAPDLPYVLLRGGCDIHTIAHYFSLTAARVITELHSVRGGFEPTISHSIMLRHALTGISAEARAAMRPFGFIDSDFTSHIADPPADQRGIWLLSFSHDIQTMLYRFIPTGELVPIRLYTTPFLRRSLIGQDPAELKVSPEFMAHLNTSFAYVGPVPDELFQDTLRMVFAKVPHGVTIFVVLGNELAAGPHGKPVRAEGMIARNSLIRAAAEPFPHVLAVDIAAFFPKDEAPILGDHYDRMTYWRLYDFISATITAPP